MIHVVTAANQHRYHNAMEQAFRLRHRVFVEQLKWHDLARDDGREIDNFDDGHTIHMLAMKEGQVIGYQRLLPTIRPHLLSDVLPQLCEGERPVGPQIWEWTRFCVADGHRMRGRTLNPILSALLTGLVEWGLASGVRRVVAEMHPLHLLTLIQLHFKIAPLGLPQPIDGEDVVALTADFDERTLRRLRDSRADATPVLEPTCAPLNRVAA